jgi:hypothetical protein
MTRIKKIQDKKKGKAYSSTWRCVPECTIVPNEQTLNQERQFSTYFIILWYSSILKKLALLLLRQHYTWKVIQWKKVQKRDQVVKEKLSIQPM